MSSKIDPRLIRAMAEAAVAKQPVQAVVTVGTGKRSVPLLPSETESMVRGMIARAADAVSGAPHKLVIFPNIQSFSIEAEPDLLSRILEEEEVDAATLNALPEADKD